MSNLGAKWTLAVFVALVLNWSATAAAFDVIVPSVANNDTTERSAFAHLSWGWLVATSDTISQADLDSAVLTASIDDAQITVEPFSFVNTENVAPLDPGEVGGYLPDLGGHAEFDALLEPGEELAAPDRALWLLRFEFPENHVGSATLTATVQIGAYCVDYSTTANFGDFDPPGPDIYPAQYYPSAQRLSSTSCVQRVLDYLDDAVEDGTLSGSGPGNSGAGRLGALRNMLEGALSSHESGATGAACQQLSTALLRTDGAEPPPDFVEGPAQEELGQLILGLLDSLGCP